ncbi:MAG: exosome complex protein Rrp42 [Nanoarchaeota archaeon]|nr:exosome complex protein Rrp42 [Nanoarchaeota archaeon]
MTNQVRTTPNITGERIKEYLKKGKRFDGRTPEQFREIIIERDVSKKAEGSVRVKMGKTEVVVGVKLGLAEPYPDSPNKGNLMTTAELLPLSSERFENGPPKFPAIETGRVIDRILRESGFIDFEKLCIEEGKKVWNLFVDIYSINDDGNLLDAAGIGAVAALRVAKMPKYDAEKDKIDYDTEPTGPVPLKEIPVSITVHKVGDSLIVDPTREEEDLSETRVTIGGNAEGRISSMQKGEAASIDAEQMKQIFDMAEKVIKEIANKIEKDLK